MIGASPVVGPAYVRGERPVDLQPASCSSSDITLRVALPEDADTLTALTRRSKGSHGYDAAMMAVFWDDMGISPETIARDTVVVAEQDGRALGFAHLMPIDSPDTIYLENLFIEPDAQGRGLGKILFDWALAEAGRHGYRWLEWDSDPNASAFYLKMGGEIVSESESSSFAGRMIPKFRKRTRSLAARGTERRVDDPAD